MNGIYLLLGSNIEDRMRALNTAVSKLQASGMQLIDHSAVYETAPWGILDQNWFLNVGLKVETSLSSHDLLLACQKVETQMGRERKLKWGPRIIDIDILYYGNQIIDSGSLKVPHPGIPDRKFTLILLNDLAPDETHPALGLTQSQLLEHCEDQSEYLPTKYQLDIDLA
ncbi:MAG: 2-amino-4-hydroxy-6-hydroxymethyldihydropteridine diphosphokinase [Cyclobacteriaceae bacterium]|nr:2-amino-4-hydroxy-6-hydroxymethyldihydropteridine diphosphokinase [Cyclobacteriaceae bacterium SS2]